MLSAIVCPVWCTEGSDRAPAEGADPGIYRELLIPAAAVYRYLLWLDLSLLLYRMYILLVLFSGGWLLPL